MTSLAIGVYIAYLLLAFVLRTLVQLRRTGDSGFRGLSGRPGSAEWWAGVLFGIALTVGVAAPVVGALGLGVVDALDHRALNLSGLLLAVAGIGLTLAAQLRMGSAWRIGVDANEQTPLVTDGLFGVVRNPIFTAMALTGLGLTLMVPNAVAIVGLAVLVVALELQVRVVEEPYLHGLHRFDYRRYASSTGRFLPFVGRGASMDAVGSDRNLEGSGTSLRPN